ncbi:subtilisin-like protease PR1F [Cordyceps javanica]|uniref:Subtilisin-like protease PR1F n=1 Tax=Cordyceps javanica TaxID=43265 RepID=A0A545V0X7_9HYPO|nr:subtilisin-like protease PR1F [Cordyceps javanica]TQW02529.1 subtilisin-like protease PR1F [Cordyceps javanica]
MKASVVLVALLGLASSSPTQPAGEQALQYTSLWNLHAISHRSSDDVSPYLQEQGLFPYVLRLWPSDEAYYAYVIDSGIRVTHDEFEGRAENLWTFQTTDGMPDYTDYTGHGTHVAGTIAAKTYGVTKQARVLSVKVAGDEHETRTTILIHAIAASIEHIIRFNRQDNAVINISWGGDQCSRAMNTIIRRGYNGISLGNKHQKGVLVVVAAGNACEDASAWSPASASAALTVGAIDQNWEVAEYSNYGSSVNIFAPGTDILSAGWRSDSDQSLESGTSMATPHVSGLALNAMAVFGQPSSKVRSFLELTATKDRIGGDLRGSPNFLVNNNVFPQKLSGRDIRG